MIAIRRWGVDPNSIDTIVLSHLHGDHFGGLPFFLVDAQLMSRRIRPLTIAGPPGTEQRVIALLEACFPGASAAKRKFDVEFAEMEAEARHALGEVAVTPYEVEHPSGAPSYALRVEVDGKTIAYSGDTQWTESLVEAGRGADLFIGECCFVDQEVRYHMNLTTWRKQLPRIEPKRVIFTHMGPEMLAAADSIEFETAEEGMTIEL